MVEVVILEEITPISIQMLGDRIKANTQNNFVMIRNDPSLYGEKEESYLVSSYINPDYIIGS